jgi:hypothetical protein
MFKPIVQELLIIEQSDQRKFNKIKAKILGELGQPLGIFGKPLMNGISWR